jgi:hypothetical protein
MNERIIGLSDTVPESERKIMSPEERYLHDPEFRMLVDAMFCSINERSYSASDFIAAIELASKKYHLFILEKDGTR